MSITDELREFVETHLYLGATALGGWKEGALAIADRIDDAALSERNAAYNEGYDSARESVIYDMRREHDEWVADRDANWVKLPVDADGEPIHIGDVMENVVSPSIHREVTGVGAECFYAWEDGFGRYSQFDAPNYRHHHEPTVEDVLREMADRIYADEYEPRDRDAIVAEYAAKLRLAGDGE